MADGPQGGMRSARGIAVAAGVVVVVVLLVLWLVLRGGSDDKPSADKSASSAPSQTTSTSAVPTGNPTAKPPPAPKPLKHLPKPVKTTLGSTADSGGLSVDVTKVEAVTGKARGIGERGGPSLRFTIAVTNKGSSQKNLDLAVVNAFYGSAETPADELSGPGVQRLPQTLEPGRKAEGRYVFLVPESERGHVRLDFSYNIGEPRVIFTGSAS